MRGHLFAPQSDGRNALQNVVAGPHGRPVLSDDTRVPRASGETAGGIGSAGARQEPRNAEAKRRGCTLACRSCTRRARHVSWPGDGRSLERTASPAAATIASEEAGGDTARRLHGRAASGGARSPPALTVAHERFCLDHEGGVHACTPSWDGGSPP